MLDLVIFGGPGSGKGTQSDRLVEHYGLHHISTGELLRDHIARGTELGRVADTYISKGQLIPDDLMIRVLEHHLLNDVAPDTKGVIFDGFPRTIPQAEALDALLESHGRKIGAVIGLEVPDEILTERMLLRGKLTGRADDNEDTIARRLKVYHDQTSPLRDYYKKSGKYVAIDGKGTIDDIFDDIRKSID